MPSSGSNAKARVIKMHFEIPIEPHTASRPRWTNSGNLTVTHMPKGYSDAAKYIGLNDLWIQDCRAIKRYTAIDSDETPHIEVNIWRIEKGGRLT